MLPEDCVQENGPVERAIYLILSCWKACSKGYQEPDQLRLSKLTKDKIFFPDNLPMRFQSAEVVVDDEVPNGTVELHNTRKPSNPLSNGRVVFQDFGDSQ
jgi:hypothetical protein